MLRSTNKLSSLALLLVFLDLPLVALCLGIDVQCHDAECNDDVDASDGHVCQCCAVLLSLAGVHAVGSYIDESRKEEDLVARAEGSYEVNDVNYRSEGQSNH